MSTQFSLPHQKHPQQQQQKRFCIDDAFEEETDEAIKVYGATVCTTPPPPTAQPPPSNSPENTGGILRMIDNGNNRSYKLTNDTSRDSDSLIQDDYYYETSNGGYYNQSIDQLSCWKHPKVRENWRMVLAATLLLLIGIGLLVCSTIYLADTNTSRLQGYVFLIVGFICFVPGAYHVVYIYFAAKGKRGYHFHNLPLFT